MSDEILINVMPGETRAALVENGLLQEVHVERQTNDQLVSNIYLGKVVRVLPGMQAAFVDIGLERAGFLHESDIPVLNEAGLEAQELGGNIRAKVHDGKTLMVQVIKAPLGSKGARLSTHLSLSARYLVYMPTNTHVGISQRVETETERERLRTIIEELVAQTGVSGGFIVRTAAEGATAQELEADLRYLQRHWQTVRAAAREAKAPALIHGDLPLALRIIRDASAPSLERIRVDNPEVLLQSTHFARPTARKCWRSWYFTMARDLYLISIA